MNGLCALLLAANVSGEAALEHAARLSALGPHPWGSPRVSLAARYVESQFRAAGLSDVRLLPFESHGIPGTNVTGLLRGPGTGFVVVAVHRGHPGGGGVGPNWILRCSADMRITDGSRLRTQGARR